MKRGGQWRQVSTWFASGPSTVSGPARYSWLVRTREARSVEIAPRLSRLRLRPGGQQSPQHLVDRRRAHQRAIAFGSNASGRERGEHLGHRLRDGLRQARLGECGNLTGGRDFDDVDRFAERGPQLSGDL